MLLFLILIVDIVLVSTTIYLCEECYFISSDEVDNAICAGVITSRKQRCSKECRVFTKINRNKAKIKALQKSIRALRLETYINAVRRSNNEKKDN